MTQLVIRVVLSHVDYEGTKKWEAEASGEYTNTVKLAYHDDPHEAAQKALRAMPMPSADGSKIVEPDEWEKRR